MILTILADCSISVPRKRSRSSSAEDGPAAKRKQTGAAYSRWDMIKLTHCRSASAEEDGHTAKRQQTSECPLLIMLAVPLLICVIASETPPWLPELHQKLWNRRDLYDEIFRLATLTRDDFIELQRLLHKHNPSRQETVTKVLSIKTTFLRAKSVPLSS